MLSPAFYVEWDATGSAPVSTNRRAVAALPEDSFNRAVMGAPEVAERVQFQEPLSDAELDAYRAVWQALKAGAK